MAHLFYLSHPQVIIDPAVPVPDWDLNEVGRDRIEAVLGADWLSGVTRIVSSTEQKAITGAEMIAASLGITAEAREDMGENDRSATGYLSGAEFEAMADAFFAEPEVSVRGWERAVDAQARIVRATQEVLETHGAGDVLLVGHGGVGTLLMSHCAGWSIARDRDQPGGGGNVFTVALPDLSLVHPWRPMEDGAAL